MRSAETERHESIEDVNVKRDAPDETLRCSFCHKSQEVVGKLISTPGDYPKSYICDECVAVCNSILEEDRPDVSEAEAAAAAEVCRA